MQKTLIYRHPGSGSGLASRNGSILVSAKGLGANEADRLANYRSLFRPELDTDAISDIRMALDQGQPLGDARFIDSIERATGHRRETRPQGRSRKAVLEETGPQDQMPLDV